MIAGYFSNLTQGHLTKINASVKMRSPIINKHLDRVSPIRFPDAYRTSNPVDRPMNYFDRVLYSMQYFHDFLSSAELTVRFMAIL